MVVVCRMIFHLVHGMIHRTVHSTALRDGMLGVIIRFLSRVLRMVLHKDAMNKCLGLITLDEYPLISVESYASSIFRLEIALSAEVQDIYIPYSPSCGSIITL